MSGWCIFLVIFFFFVPSVSFFFFTFVSHRLPFLSSVFPDWISFVVRCGFCLRSFPRLDALV